MGLVVNFASLKSQIGAKHGSLADRVAAEIKDAIRGGQMKPGMRLVEGRLALDLGVSRIPVREAIRRLAVEGFVTITARRGAAVAGASEQEVREAIEMRALLEGHNARLAARRRDAKVVQRLKALLRRGEKAIEDGQTTALPGLNVRYHQETIAASANDLLREMLERLRERTAKLFTPENPDRQAALWLEHAAILHAIVEGDEDRAAELAAGHVTCAFPGSGDRGRIQSAQTPPPTGRRRRSSAAGPSAASATSVPAPPDRNGVSDPA